MFWTPGSVKDMTARFRRIHRNRWSGTSTTSGYVLSPLRPHDQSFHWLFARLTLPRGVNIPLSLLEGGRSGVLAVVEASRCRYLQRCAQEKQVPAMKLWLFSNGWRFLRPFWWRRGAGLKGAVARTLHEKDMLVSPSELAFYFSSIPALALN